MENQHRKIAAKRMAGWRELTGAELADIAELKKIEASLCSLCDELAERAPTMSAKRWAALARTNLETGMMFAVKTVAQPSQSLGTFLADRPDLEDAR